MGPLLDRRKLNEEECDDPRGPTPEESSEAEGRESSPARSTPSGCLTLLPGGSLWLSRPHLCAHGCPWPGPGPASPQPCSHTSSSHIHAHPIFPQCIPKAQNSFRPVFNRDHHVCAGERAAFLYCWRFFLEWAHITFRLVS